jgi:capsular polysaccharide biosynthesis protein
MIDLAAPPLPPQAPEPRRGRAAPLLAVAMVCCVGAASFAIWPVQKSDWVAKVRAVVEPSESKETSPAYAYELDVLSRQGVMPTFAGLVQTRDVLTAAQRDVRRELGPDIDATVTATSARFTAVITVTVRSDRRDVAAAMADAIRRHGVRHINKLKSLYTARAVSAPGQVIYDRGILVQRAGALAVVWSLGVLGFVWLVRRSRRGLAA